MKNIPINLLLCLVMLSCTTKQKDSAKTDSVAKTVTVPVSSGVFDLSKLTMKEDLPDVMAAQGIKSEQLTDEDKTLFGYDVFKSSIAKALRFAGSDLSGSSGKNKNHVLFHYNSKSKKLAVYELVLYTNAQVTALVSELNKWGPPAAEKTMPSGGAIELDEDGNAVKPKPGEKQVFRVWENKTNGLTYFLGEQVSKQSVVASLTVLNRSEQSGKDWVSFRSLNVYDQK